MIDIIPLEIPMKEQMKVYIIQIMLWLTWVMNR